MYFPLGLKESVYDARVLSNIARRHFPVSVSHKRTEESNEQVAMISGLPSEVFGHHPMLPIESVCPTSVMHGGDVMVLSIVANGSPCMLRLSFPTVHIRAVLSSEHEAKRVPDGLNLI